MVQDLYLFDLRNLLSQVSQLVENHSEDRIILLLLFPYDHRLALLHADKSQMIILFIWP